MSITDYYEPYVFADPSEGPGCGQESHDSDCLCDVDPELADAVPKATVIGTFHLAAAGITGLPTNGVELERWAAELLGLHGAMIDRGIVTLNTDAAEEVRSRFRMKYDAIRRGSAGGGRAAYQAEVRDFLRLGMSLREIASYVEVDLQEICDTLNRSGIPSEAYTTAEQMLRAGAQSYGVVANATGLSRHVVKRLADAMGVNTTAKVLRSMGAGTRYSPEQYQRILDLRDEGKTYTQIASILGINRNAVVGVVRRRKDK